MARALIAMSGGVDSSVAALLMKDAGYECIGATMKLFDSTFMDEKSSCVTDEDVNDARNISHALGMEHFVFNFADHFEECVIRKFVSAYENGMTPNPCIDCNRYLKFEKLFDAAKEMGCDVCITGHYAQVEYDENRGRWLLKKAADPKKDQSYVLYSLNQEQLKMARFPLGGLEKSKVREIAEQNGFINANKGDSQDICFVPDGDYAAFIERYRGKTYPAGDFLSTDGKKLGTHRGIIRYTIGQRKGLYISAPEPYYVCKVDPDENTVVLGSESDLRSARLIAKGINLISVENLYEPMRVKAKVRYRHTEQWATVKQLDEDTIEVVFDEPQRAVTKGQSVVLYDGDIVVGGGIIA